MKKFMLFITVMIFFATITYADSITPQDLIFKPQGEGKFIYCNNDEAIWRWNLSDNSNPNPAYIMNNDNLGIGKYSMFVSHLNHTEAFDTNGKMKEMGFDIELDAQFIAKQDTKIVIKAVGFETQKLKTYIENGLTSKTQTPWDCIGAWADYKQMPIYTINSYEKSVPHNFSPIEISLKAGEEVWLSKFIDNYSTVGFLKAVHFLADFEIIEGSADINIAALKSNGILKDRSQQAKNAKRGTYNRDRQYKGIADTLPAVNANLSYAIDDSIQAGTLLPVKVYNQYNLNGNVVTKWFTNINPQEDIWARNSCTESDMLSFDFFDESKINHYSSIIPQEQRNTKWVFDVFHSDTLESSIGVPNYKLTNLMDNRGNGCNLGNYGVSTNYKVTINNTGDKKRYLNYKLNANATNIVVVKDGNGSVINDLAVRKRANGSKLEDTMASVEIPAKASTTFTIEVTLPPNFPGGMENSFEISDSKYNYEFLKTNKTEINLPYQFTEKEYIKWYGGKLYSSSDCENWTEKEISKEAAGIFENHWSNYEIKYFDGVYVVRWNEYDAAPYFYNDVLSFCNRVYYFDDNFNLITTHYFEGYPSDITYKDGKIVTSVEGKQFLTSVPKLEKTISVKLDSTSLNFDVNPVVEGDRTLVPIRTLFESMGANVTWNEETKTAKVVKNNQIIEFTIDSKTAFVNGVEKYMDVPARQYDFRTLVPLRFISETLGYNVAWDDIIKTVTIKTANNKI